MLATIYALAEPDSDNVRYCGKTVRPLSYRISAHRADIQRQSHRHLYRWLRKVYDAGKEPTVMVCEEIELDGLERTEQLRLLNEAERRWISQFRVLGFDLTNGTDGGDGCHGRIVSEGTRQKVAASHTGKKRSPEACANIRLAAQQRPRSVYLRGETHPQYGKSQQWKDPEARATKLRGENNPHTSLKTEQVFAIYADDEGTYKEIAIRHNTTEKVVTDIKTGKTWSQVTNHDPSTNRRRKPGRRPRQTQYIGE